MSQIQNHNPCEICSIVYDMPLSKAKYRTKGKIANGRYICIPCSKELNKKNLVKVGTIALSNISPSDRKINASVGGKKSAENYDPSTNKGRFSSERWDMKTEEEKIFHVTRANAALRDKIANDDIFREEYNRKTFGRLKIGYVSAGQKSLFNELSGLGFEMEYLIGSCTVDMCQPDLKIVVEYNGDFWHCNPRTWKENDYNKCLKMTAKEKWDIDRRRYCVMRKYGYTVIVVWESGWKSDKQKYIERIHNEISEKVKNTQ